MSRRQHNNNNSRRDGRPNGGNSHLIGSEVSVVQKHDQGTGRLTKGVVAEILTNSEFHPRGIKVRLSDGTVGRISDGSQQQQHRYDDTEDTAAQGPPRPSLADFMVDLVPKQKQKQPNRSSQGIIPPSSDEWACPACTFLNSGLILECEICQTARQ
jgi:uncharacterized repeat protein (TIGR03833 family)